GERVRLRVRENEQERTTLDQLRLIAIDHTPGVRAFTLGDRVVLSSPIAARRVTTSAGVDVTGLVSGSGGGFDGAPGDTLLVESGASPAASVFGDNAVDAGGPFFIIGDGGKCPADCGGGGIRSGGTYSSNSIDAQVLAQSGVLIQELDGVGNWQTVAKRIP